MTSYHLILGLPAALIAPLIGAIGSAVGGAASLLSKPKAPPPPLVPPPPAPATNPQGTNTSGQPQQSPSFLAAAASPQQGQTIGGGTGKTLLGQ